MSPIISVLSKYYRSYSRYTVILLILAFFIIASVFAYYKYAKPYFAREGLTSQSDIANATNRGKEVDILFFHVDWCPHCTRAQPTWDSFSEEFNGTLVNGYKINCVDINCTKDDDAKIQEMVSSFNILSYPTIKMKKDGDQIEFDSKISKESLNKFIYSVLN